MPKPTSYPEWATEPTLTPADILEPSQVKKEIGWVQGEIPPREFFNWLTKNQYDWIKWFDEQTDINNVAIDELLQYVSSLLAEKEAGHMRSPSLVPHLQASHPFGGGSTGPQPQYVRSPQHRSLRLYPADETFGATSPTPNHPAGYINPAWHSADGSYSRRYGIAAHRQQNFNGIFSVEDDGGRAFLLPFRYTLDGLLRVQKGTDFLPSELEVMTQSFPSPGVVSRTYAFNAAVPGEYYWVVFDAERAANGLPPVYLTQVPISMTQWCSGADNSAFGGYDYSSQSPFALIKVIDASTFDNPVATFCWLVSGGENMFGPTMRVGQNNNIVASNTTPRVEPVSVPVPGTHFKTLRNAVRALGIMRGEWNRVKHDGTAAGVNEIFNLDQTMLSDALEYGCGFFDEIEVVGRCYEGVNPWIPLFAHLKIRGMREDGERFYNNTDVNKFRSQVEFDFYDYTEWVNNGLDICLAGSVFRCGEYTNQVSTYILEDVTIEGIAFWCDNKDGVQSNGHHNWFPDHLNVPDILAVGGKVVDISSSNWTNLVVSNFKFKNNWTSGLMSDVLYLGQTFADDVIDFYDIEISGNRFDNLGNRAILMCGELLFNVHIKNNMSEGRWGQFSSAMPEDDGAGNWNGVGFQDISKTNYFVHLVCGGAFFIMDDIYIENNTVERHGTKAIYLETENAFPDNIHINNNVFTEISNRAQYINQNGSAAGAGWHPCQNAGLGGINNGIRYVDMHVVELTSFTTFFRNIEFNNNTFEGSCMQSAYYVSVVTWPTVDRYLFRCNNVTGFNLQNNLGFTPPQPDVLNDPVVTSLNIPSGVLWVENQQSFARGTVIGNTDTNTASPMSFLIEATLNEETAPPRILLSNPNGAPFPDAIIGDAADDYSNSPPAWYRF